MKKTALLLILALVCQFALLSSCILLPPPYGDSSTASSGEDGTSESVSESVSESTSESVSESTSESSSDAGSSEIPEHRHIYDGAGYSARTATCSSNGRLAGQRCSICHQINPADILPKDPTRHSYDGEFYEAKAPTCTSSGLIEGYACSGCGAQNPADGLPPDPTLHV